MRPPPLFFDATQVALFLVAIVSAVVTVLWLTGAL